MTDSVSQLVVTDVGLAAASVATPTGPFVQISGFRVGSGFGYTPLKTDTNLNGVTLYSGTPSTYKYVGDNTLDVICKLPAEAGPFEFGEVCLDLPSTVMFAKAAFDKLQTKYSSLGTNVLATYTFHCLVKLSQPVAIFKVDTILGEPPMVWEVDAWTDVYPPALSANPDIPTILVKELDQNGNSTLLTQASDQHWTVASNYHFIALPLIIGGNVNTITLDGSVLPATIVNNVPYTVVIEDDYGYLRPCASVSANGSNYDFALMDPLVNVPDVGNPATVYMNVFPPDSAGIGPTNLTVTGDATGNVNIAGGAATLNLTVTAGGGGVGPTTLTLTGDATGSTVISGGAASLNVHVNAASIQSRQQTWLTAGTHSFVVPPDVYDLFWDLGGSGAGGGGSGTGYSSDYSGTGLLQAGGGGGGGGAGQIQLGYHTSVTPGETITIVVGPKGIGASFVAAPGQTGSDGQAGSPTSISGSFGAHAVSGGTSGKGGKGYGAPSGEFGAGGEPGVPAASWGGEGPLDPVGGNGGSSPFGFGGAGGRAGSGGAAGNPGADGIAGDDATGNCSGGGGGASAYITTSTSNGGEGGDGTDGYAKVSW